MLYGAVLTSPNMVVLGEIGRGKSSFVKAFVRRQRVFGRQAWVVDPKGEYGPLACACGAVPLRIGPGSGLRLNPLEACLAVRGRARGPGAGAQAGEPHGVWAGPLLLGEFTVAEVAMTAFARCYRQTTPARRGRQPGGRAPGGGLCINAWLGQPGRV